VARRAVELSIEIFGEGHPVTRTAMLEQTTALRRLRRKGLARELEKCAKACGAAPPQPKRRYPV
jgi:hypothetical protein